jgi:uncharacterized protein
MKIVAAGVSGFLGTALLTELRSAGHQVTTLVRRPPSGADQVRWDPDHGELDDAVLAGADAVVNLGGVGVGDKRWTDAYREQIRSSRVRPTALLAQAVAARGVPVLVNASAVGYYGDRGDEEITETSLPGTGFLADVCIAWEAATTAAEQGGARVVRLRTGLPLGKDGGLLAQLVTLSKLFLAGRLGSGRQFCPWISLTDQVRAMRWAIEQDAVRGPLDVSAPTPVRNGELVREIAHAVHRPAPWWVPGPALRLVLGGFAGDVLGGQRALPAALLASGFEFRHTDLRAALAAELA